MMRILAWLIFRCEIALDTIIELTAALQERRDEKQQKFRLNALRAMDENEVRREGDIGSLILAGQIEAAKALDS